jgi:hypothetical protein
MAFINKNQSNTFNMTISSVVAFGGLSQLSAFQASEVLISNKSGQDIYIYDNGLTSETFAEVYQDSRRFLLSDSESMVLRGITDTSQVSAKIASGQGTIYFRSAFFSNLNQF